MQNWAAVDEKNVREQVNVQGKVRLQVRLFQERGKCNQESLIFQEIFKERLVSIYFKKIILLAKCERNNRLLFRRTNFKGKDLF